jgi:hypothetical protein
LEAAGVDQARHENEGFFASELAGGFDGFVQGSDFAEEAFAAAELCGASG